MMRNMKPLIDQSTGQQIGWIMLMILAEYNLLVQTAQSEVFDVALIGTGMAYLARWQLFNVRWERADTTARLRW
jgi:hypothetical protein